MPTLPPTKKYYTIGEVAQLLHVAPSLVRFWEKKFPALRPKKSAQGTRKYTAKDIALLKRIYHLVKERGYTLAGAQGALQSRHETQQPEAHTVAIQSLRALRGFLVTLRDAPQ